MRKAIKKLYICIMTLCLCAFSAALSLTAAASGTEFSGISKSLDNFYKFDAGQSADLTISDNKNMLFESGFSLTLRYHTAYSEALNLKTSFLTAGGAGVELVSTYSSSKLTITATYTDQNGTRTEQTFVDGADGKSVADADRVSQIKFLKSGSDYVLNVGSISKTATINFGAQAHTYATLNINNQSSSAYSVSVMHAGDAQAVSFRTTSAHNGKFTEKASGVYNVTESSNGGVQVSTVNPVAIPASGEIFFNLRINDSPGWDGAEDNWLLLTLTAGRGYSALDKATSLISKFLRVTGVESQPQVHGEMWIKGKESSPTIYTPPISIPAKIISVSVKITDKNTEIKTNSSTAAVVSDVKLSDFPDGVLYASIRSHAQDSYTGSRHLDFDVSASNSPLLIQNPMPVEVGSADVFASADILLNGSTVSSVKKISGGAAETVASGDFNVSNGKFNIKRSALGISQEGDKAVLVLTSAKNSTLVNVVGVDNSQVTSDVYEKTFTMPDGGDVVFDVNTFSLTDIAVKKGNTVLSSAQALCESGELTFKKEYLATLSYGRIEFTVVGTRPGQSIASTKFTVRVNDSRSPAFVESRIEYNAETAAPIPLQFNIYDASITRIDTENVTLSAIDYTGALTLNISAVNKLSYGANILTVTTNKNTASIEIVKYDSRAAVINPSVTVFDKKTTGDIACSATWYDKTVTGISINGGEALTKGYTVTSSGLTLKKELLYKFSARNAVNTTGANVITVNLVDALGVSKQLTLNFTVTDTRAAELKSAVRYDTVYPADAVYEFYLYEHTLAAQPVQYKENGSFIRFLTNSENLQTITVDGERILRLTIAKDWFDGKSAGDQIEFKINTIFELVPYSLDLPAKVINSQPAAASYDKVSSAPCAPIVDLNGKEIISVKNGTETLTDSQFSYSDNKLQFSAEYIEELALGAHTFTIQTPNYSLTLSLTLTDTRTPALQEGSGGIVNRDLGSSVLSIGIRVFEYTFDRIEYNGETVAATNFTYDGKKLEFKQNYLASLGRGIHKFKFVYDTDDLDFTVVLDDTRAFKFTASSQKSYDKGSPMDISFNAEFYFDEILSVTTDSQKVAGSVYSRSGNTLKFSSSYLSGLNYGEHLFIITSRYGSAQATIIVTDSREIEIKSVFTSLNYILESNKDIVLKVAVYNKSLTSVTAGGKTFVEGTDYTYDAADGEIIIRAAALKTLEPENTQLVFATDEAEVSIDLNIRTENPKQIPCALIGVAAGLVPVIIAAVLLFTVFRKKRPKNTNN